ncbi:MAG: molecular chaperone TorD family protein [Geminicoccaceae bacterium]
MSTAVEIDGPAAAGRLAAYRLFARLFAWELDGPALTALGDGALLQILMEATDGQPPPSPGLLMVERMLAQGDGALESDLRVAYAGLFHGGQPDSAPPYESYYRDAKGRLFGQSTTQMADLLRQHGLTPAAHVREPLDHVAIQLQLMAELVLKAAVEQQRQLLDQHLLVWIPAFARACERCDRSRFYAAAADLLRWFITEDAAFLGEGASPRHSMTLSSHDEKRTSP